MIQPSILHVIIYSYADVKPSEMPDCVSFYIYKKATSTVPLITGLICTFQITSVISKGIYAYYSHSVTCMDRQFDQKAEMKLTQ
jgi:hypothetical protein